MKRIPWGWVIVVTVWMFGVALLIYVLKSTGGITGQPGKAPILREAATQVITRYITDSSAWVRQRDSLRRELRALRADSARLVTALETASRDTVIAVTDTVSNDSLVVLFRGGWQKCQAVLDNCEERNRTNAALVSAAEASARQARKRAAIVAGVSVAVVLGLLIAR